MTNANSTVAEALPAYSHSLYMTIAVPVCNRGPSSTLARSSKKRTQNTAIALVTAVVKEENVLDNTEVAELLHVSLVAEAAPEALMQMMRPVCCVYTKTLCNLLETDELEKKKIWAIAGSLTMLISI